MKADKSIWNQVSSFFGYLLVVSLFVSLYLLIVFSGNNDVQVNLYGESMISMHKIVLITFSLSSLCILYLIAVKVIVSYLNDMEEAFSEIKETNDEVGITVR